MTVYAQCMNKEPINADEEFKREWQKEFGSMPASEVARAEVLKLVALVTQRLLSQLAEQWRVQPPATPDDEPTQSRLWEDAPNTDKPDNETFS
jgi:hypothetical protein